MESTDVMWVYSLWLSSFAFKIKILKKCSL